QSPRCPNMPRPIVTREGTAFSQPLRLTQQLESMLPFVAQKTANAPEPAERLDGASGLDFAHVRRLPAELIEDAPDNFLRTLVVAAHEHGRLAVLELRVDEERVTDGIERLDEARAGELALQALHLGIVEIGEELQDAVCRRRIGDR